MPMFRNVPLPILKLIVESQFPRTILTPDSVRKWLRQCLEMETLTVAAAIHLLKYMSSDERMDQLFQLPIFLCRDGRLRSLTLRQATPNINRFTSRLYIGTGEEYALFDTNGKLFLQLDKYPRHITSRILENISKMSEALNLDVFGLQVFPGFAHDILFH